MCISNIGRALELWRKTVLHAQERDSSLGNIATHWPIIECHVFSNEASPMEVDNRWHAALGYISLGVPSAKNLVAIASRGVEISIRNLPA